MLSERNYPEPERVHTTKVSAPPGRVPPAALTDTPDIGPRLWQFNFTHPSLQGNVCVSVFADAANARGLAYLVAEEFCAQVIGQIKAS